MEFKREDLLKFFLFDTIRDRLLWGPTGVRFGNISTFIDEEKVFDYLASDFKVLFSKSLKQIEHFLASEPSIQRYKYFAGQLIRENDVIVKLWDKDCISRYSNGFETKPVFEAVSDSALSTLLEKYNFFYEKDRVDEQLILIGENKKRFLKPRKPSHYIERIANGMFFFGRYTNEGERYIAERLHENTNNIIFCIETYIKP